MGSVSYLSISLVPRLPFTMYSDLIRKANFFHSQTYHFMLCEAFVVFSLSLPSPRPDNFLCTISTRIM